MRDQRDEARTATRRALPRVAGIFVGGRSTRMGGAPKGLLDTPSGETIVARWQRLLTAIGIEVVLVGKHDAYAPLQIESLADHPAGIGPLGGLIALLERGHDSDVIAVACDMPYVSSELLAKLAHAPSTAPALAPRRGTVWEPLFARYTPARCLDLARRRVVESATSLQGLLDDLPAERLSIEEVEYEQLRDWDAPEDISKAR